MRIFPHGITQENNLGIPEVVFLCSVELLRFNVALLAHLAAGKDEYVGILLRRAALLAFAGRSALERTQAAVTTAHAAFATTVRMIYRVHRRTANCWTNAHLARAASFADVH